MKKKTSFATISRLCTIYDFLSNEQGKKFITSQRIEEYLNFNSDSVRKDLNILGEVGKSATGYEVEKLKTLLAEKLGLQREIRICIIGLGKIGKFLLEYEKLKTAPFVMVAGFDNSLNRIETLMSDVPLFSAYEIERIVKEKKIEVALLAVSKKTAQSIADRLTNIPIPIIVNFSSCYLKAKGKETIIHNIDIAVEIYKLIATYFLK